MTSTGPLVILLACLAFALLPSFTTPAAVSTPVFQGGSTTMPLAQGWLGADASYTIALGPYRWLWLFDDTLSADSPTSNRSHCHFVHNTIGIMTCDDTHLSNCSIQYYWSDADRQQGFWLTGHESDKEPLFYWVLDVFLHNGTLYVFLQTTRNVPYGLNFEVVGSALVSVSNPHDDPTQWRKAYQPISNTNVTIPGQTAIVHTGPRGNPHPADPRGAEYLYTHTFVSPAQGKGETVLMRLRLSHLGNVSKEAGGGSTTPAKASSPRG